MNVRFWYKADIGTHSADVRYWGESRHSPKLLTHAEARRIAANFAKLLGLSQPDPMTADKIVDLRDKFRDAYTGWLEIEKEAA